MPRRKAISRDQALWVLPIASDSAGGERKPFRLLPNGVNESGGEFSPDGRFVVYTSLESQRPEVSVASFSGREGPPASTWRVSAAGGSFPRWRRDGKEIFFRAPNTEIMAAEVTIKGDLLQVGTIRSLLVIGVPYPYVVSTDGQRFLIPLPPAKTESDPVVLVQNWVAALK